MKLSRSFWVAVGISVVLVIAVAYFAAGPKQTPTQVAAFPTPALVQATIDGSDPFALLTPLDNGPGVLVADPVPDAKVGPEAAALGTGCTRWLQFVLSSHGELGQTPAWSQIVAALHRSERKDWRLKPDNSRDLELPSRMLGVTHVMTSRIAGDAKNFTLTLQLQEVPSGKTVGEALTLSGAPEQIVAVLPGTAKTLLTALGVREPRVPSAVGVTPADLTVCGQALLDPWGKRSPQLTARLSAIGAKFPLATMVVSRDDPHKRHFGPVMMELAGDNLTVAAYLADTALDQLTPYNAKWGKLQTDFPQNYQVALVKNRTSGSNALSSRTTAEYAVRTAPRNPQAWIELAYAIGNQSEEVRQSRTFDQMTKQDQDTVTKLYSLEQAAAERATKLDEQNGEAWRMLSVAATFNGDNKAADGAFWLAQSLMPDDPRVYNWGMQMYQPKWGGDPKVLLKLAELVTAKDERLIAVGGSLAEAIGTVDNDDPHVQKIWSRLFDVTVAGPQGYLQFQPARRARVASAWKAVQGQPHSPVAWQKLAENVSEAAAVMRMGRSYPELNSVEQSMLNALYAFWQFADYHLTELQPANGRAWLDYAKAISFAPNYVINRDDAFNKALSLAPHDPGVCAWGLQMYQPKWGGSPDQLWQLVQRIDKEPALFQALAADIVDALQATPNPAPEQQAMIQKAGAQLPAMEKRTNDLRAQKRLEHFWTGRKDYLRARRAAENVVRLLPQDADAHFRLGGTYHNALYGKSAKTDNTATLDNAVKEYRRAIELDPEQAEAGFYLGRLLQWKGQAAASAAAAAYGQAVKAQPYWAQALLEWGQALEMAKQKKQAEDAYLRILDIPFPDGVRNATLQIARARLQSLAMQSRFLQSRPKKPINRSSALRH